MRLLVVLIAWFLRRRLDLAQRLDPDSLWRGLFAHLPAVPDRWAPKHRWVVLAVFMLVVLVTAAVAEWLNYSVGSWAAGLLALALFLPTTGLPGWREPLEAYAQSWRRGDNQGAWHHVRHLLPAHKQSRAIAPDALHLLLVETLILATFERYFRPVFWYLVLGPAGLMLAVLGHGLQHHHPAQPVRSLFHEMCWWVDWAPRHLLSLSFGLAGDFSGWSHQRQAVGRAGTTSEALLLAASGALSSYSLDPRRFQQFHPEQWPDYGLRSLDAVRELLNRSMVVWITAVAILAILGWIR